MSKLGPTRLEQMEAFERASFAAALVKAALNSVSLIAGAVLISMAYQSWEVGCGVACLVFFHKLDK